MNYIDGIIGKLTVL